MSSYYFLKASLPDVVLGAVPSITMDAFVALCAEKLSRRDMASLEALLAPSEATATHGFIAAWCDVDRRLRNALVEARAARLKREAAPSKRLPDEYDTNAHRAAFEAMSQSSPLERERMLDRYRWEEAEALAGFDPFSSEALLAYAVKLGLAWRWTAWNEEEGAVAATAFIESQVNPETMAESAAPSM